MANEEAVEEMVVLDDLLAVSIWLMFLVDLFKAFVCAATEPTSVAVAVLMEPGAVLMELVSMVALVNEDDNESIPEWKHDMTNTQSWSNAFLHFRWTFLSIFTRRLIKDLGRVG